MKFTTYSHCDGDKSIPSRIANEVSSTIGDIKVKPTVGASSKLRDNFLVGIKKHGWSSEVAVSKNSNITITSIKDEIGLCLQTGNMGRMYADLIKLQTMYLDGSIKASVIVLPSMPVAKLLGSNIAQADRLIRELGIFKKAYHVPTLIFSLE